MKTSMLSAVRPALSARSPRLALLIFSAGLGLAATVFAQNTPDTSGGRRRGGPPPGGAGGGGDRTSSRGTRGGGPPEMELLSSALRDKLPDAEIKMRLDRLREARKANEANLAKAQDELRAVLSVRQEAVAVMFGLLP
jgi:hypothetical protein